MTTAPSLVDRASPSRTGIPLQAAYRPQVDDHPHAGHPTYWDPFRDMHQLRPEIEGLIDRAASGAKSAVGAPWRPVSDVVETDDSIMITAELPGCNDEDVEVLVHGRLLTIRGTRTMQESSETEHYRWVERSYGDVERSFRLPDAVTESDIHAKVAYGVLQVKIALPRAGETARIPVSGGD